jgi:hypothetical protein
MATVSKFPRHQQTGEIDNLTVSWGKVYWLCCVEVPQRHLLVPLPKSASNNLREWFLSPTDRLNLGIITEGKLTTVLIMPSSWGFPSGHVRHQEFF